VNRWQAAIRDQLVASGAPLSTGQIWDKMIAAGFQHKSASPRSTLGARLAELVAQGDLSRVGLSTYQIAAQQEVQESLP
jgi:hypothetical protein